MLVEGDDPEAVKSLGAAVYKFARAFQCHVLEVLGFPTNLRQVFSMEALFETVSSVSILFQS
jgi:hypothetical protein